MSTDLELAPIDGEIANATPAQQTARVGTLLELAVERGMDPSALEKLVALQEHVMARQAKTEFAIAMKELQAECPIIDKNSTADTGKYTYKFASLPHIAGTLRPLCEKFGFSYTFDSEVADNRVSVICKVKHIGGHEEPTKFTAPIDQKAVMNDTQKFASASSYCQRYSLCLAFGIVTGFDDDGKTLHPNPGQKPDAPKAQPRGEAVTAAAVKEFAASWQADHPQGKLSREEWTAQYAAWVEAATFEKFDVTKASQWNLGRLSKCKRELENARNPNPAMHQEGIPW